MFYKVLTFIFQAFSLSKLVFLSLFWSREEMLEMPNIRGVKRGDLWAGTHITINDQLSDGIQHFQKLFWNRESRCIKDIQWKSEVRKCFGGLKVVKSNEHWFQTYARLSTRKKSVKIRFRLKKDQKKNPDCHLALEGH